VRDPKRIRETEAFRTEWNKHALDDDPSGQVLINAFGRATAKLFFDYLVYL